MLDFNRHIPVMLDEIKSFIPKDRSINVIDATFGGGGYSQAILENYNIKNLIAIDRDPITKVFAKKLKKNFKSFNLIIGNFSKIDDLVKSKKELKKIFFDAIIFDLGLSSNQLDDPKRGFSFINKGPLNMDMGNAKINAYEIVNNFSEKELSDIIFKLGEERFSKKIAKKIVNIRKKGSIKNTKDLSDLINESIPKLISKKIKINPATKTFQALRIYVNDEINELKTALKKSVNLLNKDGKLIVVSFQSLEDRIVKDFFNHSCGKRWRSSRHYPELADEGPITFKIITKKPIRPNEQEINFNPRSRSAKLRVVQKII